MGVRENKVERYLKSKVESLGGIARKWVSPGHDGVPDQIVILNGVITFVEVKTTDGKLSVGQTREHNRLLNVGAKVTTVYGVAGVDQLIINLQRECK
jgi:hypothetical protein